eukprot:2191996-Amphidinium_carterae.1
MHRDRLQQGSYTFYISSDDGATLAIDKQVVINSDGSHGMEVKTYTADLPSGVHVLELRRLAQQTRETDKETWV